MSADDTTPADSLSATQAEEVDRICTRFEQAWKDGRRPRIEIVLAEAPGTLRPVLLRELLAKELKLRYGDGETPTHQEYSERFPGDIATVVTAFSRDLPPATDTTAPPSRDAAAIDLLFGVLALQMGFISRESLYAAIDVWARDKERPLASILVEHGALPAARRALLEPLVAEHLRAHGDDPERSLAAVGPIGPLRDHLRRLDQPGRAVEAESTMRRDSRDAAGDTLQADGEAGSDAAGSPDAGRRFRIIRLHARGGLGEVFLARDDELNREVALKKIQEQYAHDPRCRDRFLLEAEITSGLEHPGIVPVYSLGRDGDRRPYYAMRFIRGDSLKEAIDRFHRGDRISRDPVEQALELRQLLGRFVDVCNAVAYAHSRGVLHRDLKPANILLGPFGETLVVDWGLAKSVDRTDEPGGSADRVLRPLSGSGADPTQTGQALGTPQYMSPEQAAGRQESVGPASDVYGLGSTLYSLLTGRPPYPASDVDGLRGLLGRVERGEFAAPRQVRSGIPAALEAVCLNAMATRPEDRYGSARELAEDIDRWLADEAVSVYREPLATRVGRWMRRHRTGVVAASVAALVTLIGLGAVATVQVWANRELKRANGDLVAANEREHTARSQAEARFALARDAIEAYYTGVSRDALLKQSQLEDLRKILLGSALSFYEKLQRVLESEPGQKVRAELADAYERVGEINREIGSRPASRQAFERAVALYERLARDEPDVAVHQAALAEARRRSGQVLYEAGLGSEALPSLEAARAIYERLAREHPDGPQYRRGLAVTDSNLGTLLGFWMGRRDEALQAYRRAVDLYERLVREHPDATEYQSDSAEVQCNIGRLLGDSGHEAEGLKLLEQAVLIQRRLAHEHPEMTVFQATLARAEATIGISRANIGQQAAAMESFRRALAVFERLVREHPAVTDYQQGLSHAQHSIGWTLAKMGRPADAIPELRRALSLVERLARDHPTVTGYQERLAQSHAVIGDTLLSLGNIPEAVPEFRQAREIHERLAREHPTVGLYQSEQANDHIFIASALNQMGRRSESRQEYQRALDLYERIPNPLMPDIYNQACAHARLAAMSYPEGRTPKSGEESEARSHIERAMAELRRAVGQGYRDLRSLRSDPDLEPLRSLPDFQMLVRDVAFPDDPFAH